MIRHIVLFALAGDDEAARAAAVSELTASLVPLSDSIPGVRSLRVDADGSGIGFHWHAALVSEHDSWEALAAYQADPRHVHVLQTVVARLVTEKAVVDYEV
ncbi:Dabb family protein [Agromyces sp. Marseille-P2726]|uniref:Dabb family protein n=1 Tax=Agromyces sp. Marseille-P2726 TaxID=2709132 RepID=UPI00156D7118|nr:Dabb family protein [Agromyces sp. Marseille-P2726]